MSRDELREAEEEDDDDDPDLKLAKRIVLLDRFVKLPDKFEVHEWQIIQDFSASVENQRIRDELLNAIHGAGAFRNFKNIIRRRGIEKAWFEFRTNALTEIAVDWCKEHNIAWS